MNNLEKILELLEKKTLTKEERSELDLLIGSDPEARKLHETYLKLGTLLKSKHISVDEIRDYILYKNNLEPENKDIIKRIPEIELHLQNCEKCTDEFKVLNEEYTEVDFFIADKFAQQPENGEEKIPTSYVQAKKQRAPIYAFASIIVIGFVYLSLLVVSDLTTPDVYDLAAVSDKSDYVTRGRATDEFQESLKALENNNFDRAFQFLESDIKNNPDDVTIFYSHYILGLGYLESADNSFAGLFKSFNEKDAEQGLKNLQLCIEKNTSGKYPDITYNAYFYSAKANLMLGNTKTAKEYLNIVVAEKGSKMSEAQNLLNELE